MKFILLFQWRKLLVFEIFFTTTEGKVLAGHDISDGGLITCLLEMCFAGISGMNVNISHKSGSPIEILFTEEVGWILEIDSINYNYVLEVFNQFDVPVYLIGRSEGFGLSSKACILYIA